MLYSIQDWLIRIAISIVVSSTILGILWFTTLYDYNKLVNNNTLYCKMVKEGSWKDFNHNFDELCKK
jgi:hypothetical protein